MLNLSLKHAELGQDFSAHDWTYRHFRFICLPGSPHNWCGCLYGTLVFLFFPFLFMVAHFPPLMSLPASVSNAFSLVAFFKFVLFSILELRYMLLAWKAQRPNLVRDGWERARREVSALYARFCECSPPPPTFPS